MNTQRLIDSFESLTGTLIYNAGGQRNECKFSFQYAGGDKKLELKVTRKHFENRLLWNLQIFPLQEIEILDVHIDIPYAFSADRKLFINGYQSWSETREYNAGETEKGPRWINNLIDRKFHFKPYGDYYFNTYSQKPGHLHSYTFSYIRNTLKEIELIGSLNETNAYTIIRFLKDKEIIRVERDCCGLVTESPFEVFNLAIYYGGEDQVFDEYFSDMGIAAPKVEKITGWTSWYHYYENITHDIICENIDAFVSRKIPINIFQIDDGYQKAVGDWLETNEKFPDGMKPLVERIKASGFKAGLWLAPFVCETKSDIYKNHQDWLLKDKNGENICSGGNWSIQWALDVEKEEVKDYLREVFKKVFIDWGFDLVKLDFLYAACMNPPRHKTRGQLMYESMRFLRELSGDKMILGCGMPLGSGFGLVDYCRIGCDLDLYWERKSYRFGLLRELLSSKSAMYNAISRRFLDKLAFLNDPDVFLLRHNNIHMSEEEKNTVFYVNHTFGGLVFTSDNLNEYTGEEYRKYLSSFPFLEKDILLVSKEDDFYITHFQTSGLKYILLVNLGERRVRFTLSEGNYFRVSDGIPLWHKGNDKIMIDRHASVCMLKMADTEYTIAGSNIHMFPGSEIRSFTTESGKFDIELHKEVMNSGTIWFKVPDGIEKIWLNGNELTTYRQDNLNLVKFDIKP